MKTLRLTTPPVLQGLFLESPENFWVRKATSKAANLLL